MKFIKAKMERGTIILDDIITEIELDFDYVKEDIRNQKAESICYLFYPGDKPHMGNPVNKNVSREDYLNKPNIYGICIYKQAWSGKVQFE